jgi:hypothetical protein
MRVEEASYFGDTLQAKTLIPSAECVGNSHVAAGAGLAASKLEHQHRKTYVQDGTAVAATIPLAVIQGPTARVISIKAGTIGLNAGNATITIDLKKNGVSILTAVITLDSSKTARTLYAGTLTSTAGVAGNWLEAVIAVAAGTGTLGTGLCVQLDWDEDAIP